jgi:hypothetical protein
MTAVAGTQVLFIGGRSGVGKSSVGWELSRLFSAAQVQHALIEGDNLDRAWPVPWDHHLAERNLAAMWRNYTELGYHRMIYTNTAAVRPDAQVTLIEAITAVDAPVESVSVLLTATEATVAERLGMREQGESLAWHLRRSAIAAAELEQLAPSTVHRVATDARSAAEVAVRVAALTCWRT